jgi:hypothetical protein
MNQIQQSIQVSLQSILQSFTKELSTRFLIDEEECITFVNNFWGVQCKSNNVFSIDIKKALLNQQTNASSSRPLTPTSSSTRNTDRTNRCNYIFNRGSNKNKACNEPCIGDKCKRHAKDSKDSKEKAAVLFKNSEDIINKEIEKCDSLKSDLIEERKTSLIKRKMQKKEASKEANQVDKLHQLIQQRKEKITFSENKYGNYEYQSLIIDKSTNTIIGKQDPNSKEILALTLDDIEKCKSLHLTFTYPSNLALGDIDEDTKSSSKEDKHVPTVDEDSLYEEYSEDEDI